MTTNVNTSNRNERTASEEAAHRRKTRLPLAIIGGALAVTAIVKVAPSIPEAINHKLGGYTQEELDKMPKKEVTAQTGEGIDAVISHVDTNLSSFGLRDTEEYLKAQLNPNANSVVPNGMQFEVPIIPDKEVHSNK